VGENPTRQGSLQSVAIGAAEEVTIPLKHFGVEGRYRRLGEHAGRNASERRADLETEMCGSRPSFKCGKAHVFGEESDKCIRRSHRGIGVGMCANGSHQQHGKPRMVMTQGHQPDLREEQAGPFKVAERLVVAEKPGNAGGAKGPWFGKSVESDDSLENWR